MWRNHSDWAEDFAGVNITEAVEQQADKRFVLAHLWGIVEGTSMIIGIENCWMQLAENPKLLAQWFDRYADWLCEFVDVLAESGVHGITLCRRLGKRRDHAVFSKDLARAHQALYRPSRGPSQVTGPLCQSPQGWLHHAGHGRDCGDGV